ncbi:MAG: DUF1800 family protein [Saprospiraceae bacterium]|nr:DUF1800 family protein [Saprospiraceae bacterium]
MFTERKNEVAYYICSKLYSNFVYHTIDEEFVVQLANLFISGNWDLLPVFKAIFKSEHFMTKISLERRLKAPWNVLSI